MLTGIARGVEIYEGVVRIGLDSCVGGFLQELLVPNKLEFYDYSWRSLESPQQPFCAHIEVSGNDGAKGNSSVDATLNKHSTACAPQGLDSCCGEKDMFNACTKGHTRHRNYLSTGLQLI